MKTKFKLSNRILSIVLALVLMVGILPMTSFTASATETEYDGVIGELYYKVDQENNVTTIFGNGALSSVSSLANVMTSNVVIEEGVTSIGNTAFRGLSSLEELTVKGDVTIGNYAFQGCASLETVTFMGNVTSVGYNAFYGCASLTNINYYGTTEPSYTNTLSYITLYSFNGVSFCGLIPSNSPATEVSGWNTNMVAYSDGVTQYFTYNNYLYQVKYTNLKTVSETRINYDRYGNMICLISSSVHVNLYASDLGQLITTDMFPQTPGGVLNCYSSYETKVIDTSKPVVVITCIAVNEPTWSWNGTASATATFIAKDADVFTKANATISSETVSEATNCQTKEQIKYTATVTFNGQTYTDTKSVYGAVGPHSYTYTADGNTITETCDNGCGHTATATLTATDATYAGSPITTGAYVIYSDGWAGSQEHGEITYSNNLNVGDATAKVTVAAKELVTTFKINPANIAETTVTLDPESGTYNGSAYTPGVTVTFNGATLVEDKDYTLSWVSSDLTNAGSHTATITGKGNFTGTKNAVFSIDPADIKGAVVTIDRDTFDYDGQPHKPTAVVTFNGAVLTEGVDYELYYISKDQIMTWENGEPVKLFGTGKENCDSINAGQYYAIVFGKGNFATSSRFAYAPYTIKQAKNDWVTEPWITGWTYGKSANAPVGEAKFGTVYVLYDGTANDGTTYNGDTPPTKAGSYVARFFVDETANYEPIAYSVPFTVKKANYNMIGAEWNYREPFQYNGKEHKVEVVGLPAGVTVKNYENNTAVAVGDYYAEVSFDYDADNYNAPVINKLGWTIYNDWTPAEYTVNGSGWMNEDFVISAKNGYKISLTNTANGTWEDALTYSAETNNGSVTFYLKNETSGTISLAKTVSYKLDKTEPTGRVEFVERTGWEEFINTITFGLFYKDEVTVKVTAEDNLSGVAKIEYVYSNEAKTLNEVKEITDWTEYNGEFGVSLQDAKKFVYFVRITDNAGNVTYLSTDGAEYDTTAPVLYGIENGGVYHGDKVFKAMDKNFLKIEVDGVNITDTTEGDDEFKIVADNAEHTVTVTDKAGNVTEYKITVYKKYMVTYSNGDGGSYEKEFKYGEVITIPTNEIFKDTFRKTGHTIKEWQGYTEGMTMPLSNLTFTAVYTPCEYIVTFDQNGGAEISPITVMFGEKYGSLPSPAITGLSGGNKNWYLVDADGNVTDTNIKNLTIVSTARDHKLFIKRNVLAPSVSVVLTVPGGISDGYQYYIPGASTRVLTATVGNMNTDILEYTYQWYKDGTLIEGANSNVLTLDGNVSDSGTYKVEVTAKLKDGTNIVVNSNTATASKEQKVKILHATNTLSYDANGGEGGPQSSYTGGTSINISKETPTKEHNNFIGWNTAPDGTGESYQAEDAYIFVNDNGNGGCVVTLYARWKLVEYTITYVADGESVATEKVEHGKDATLTDVPHKDGYVGKWDSDGKNITEDTTISAVYTEVPGVNPDEVKPEDKTDLEDTKAKLEEMLKDDSYTDDDKKDIQDAIDDIDDALKVIGNVEAAIELIDKLPAVDTVKPDDEEAIKAIADAQTAYNALSDYEKSLVDEATKVTLDKLVAALVAYDIVEGDGSSWTEDSDHNIIFVVNGLFSKFVGIKVDGKDVDKANYEVKAGSTIITLKASYLDTLAVGEHTITVVYTDGSTDGTFNVHAKANSPATGDNSNMFLWIALLFISGGAVITLTVVDRKRRMASKR